MPSDDERVLATVALVNDGYETQLVHSHGIATKIRLRRFGGHGYAHLPRTVARKLREAGLSAEQVRRQLAGNALALLGSGRVR